MSGQEPTESQNLATTCLPGEQFSSNRGTKLSGQLMVEMWLMRRIPQPFLAFLDRNYHYKSVAVKFPHNAGLSLISYIGRKCFHSGIEPVSDPKAQVHHVSMGWSLVIIIFVKFDDLLSSSLNTSIKIMNKL